MARKEARVHVSIWSNPDFTSLCADDQRMYLLLLSQPTISLCGVVALTLGRWASMAPDRTTDDLRASLDRLQAAWFILVDHRTDEVLVRSFLRYDGGWKNIKVRTGMFAQRKQVLSEEIGEAIDSEILRAKLEDEASDSPSIGHPEDVVTEWDESTSISGISVSSLQSPSPNSISTHAHSNGLKLTRADTGVSKDAQDRIDSINALSAANKAMRQ